MTLRSVLRMLVVLAVLIAAIWFTMRSVDVTSLSNSLNGVSWWIVAGVIPIILASHYVRAIRWVTILSPSVPLRRPWPAFSAVLVGYGSSVIIPRIGEILRPWVFSRRTRVPLGTAISSVVLERVIDVLTLLCGLGIMFAFQHERVLRAIPGLTTQSLLLSIVLPAFVLVLAIVLVAFTTVGLGLAEVMRRRISSGFGEWLLKMMRHVREGTTAVRTPALWTRLVLQTALMWLLYAIPLWLLFKAMPLTSLASLNLVDAAFVLVILSVGVTIAPTPGALGVYQGFAQTALVQAFGASPAEGLAFGITAWLVNYGVVLVAGAISLVLEFRSGLTVASFRRVRHDIQESSSQR